MPSSGGSSQPRGQTAPLTSPSLQKGFLFFYHSVTTQQCVDLISVGEGKNFSFILLHLVPRAHKLNLQKIESQEKRHKNLI